MPRILLLWMALLLSFPVFAKKTKEVVVNYATINIRNSNGDKKSPERCWDTRKERVAQFFRRQQLSVVGCQEVLHEQLTDLLAALPEYDFEGVGREDGKQKGEYTPIFWRKDEWTRLKGGTFWLSDTPEVVGSVGWDAALTRIATYVLLQNKANGHQLMCINTHFDHVGHVARQRSASLILQKAKQIAGDTPFVLTGDFNVDMADAAYHVITHDATFPILDTYMQGAPHDGVFYTWHDFSRIPVDKCGKIDYIFASPSVKVVSTYIQPEERGESPKHFSDHNPVVARLRLP